MKFNEWLELREEKDACYDKVKSRYKVFPSAYASGALVKCRKVGAANWGNSKRESNMNEDTFKAEKESSEGSDNDLQTRKAWDQFKGGFFVGACGSAGFALICLSSIPQGIL